MHVTENVVWWCLQPRRSAPMGYRLITCCNKWHDTLDFLFGIVTAFSQMVWCFFNQRLLASWKHCCHQSLSQSLHWWEMHHIHVESTMFVPCPFTYANAIDFFFHDWEELDSGTSSCWAPSVCTLSGLIRLMMLFNVCPYSEMIFFSCLKGFEDLLCLNIPWKPSCSRLVHYERREKVQLLFDVQQDLAWDSLQKWLLYMELFGSLLIRSHSMFKPLTCLLEHYQALVPKESINMLAVYPQIDLSRESLFLALVTNGTLGLMCSCRNYWVQNHI